MRSENENQSVVKKISPLQWLDLIVVYLSIPVILFVCAGDLGWWQAWVNSVLIFLVGILGRVLAEHQHPGLMSERQNRESLKSGKPWDRILAPLMALSVGFPLIVVAGLDHRFAWSPVFPIWLNIFGLILIAAGYAFAAWALFENRYFSSVVRIQTDRGHVVCDTGPYRFVRHPGYAGNILPLIGIVLALGSLWTILPAVFALGVALIRTSLEDKTLQDELPGYRSYSQKVRYRLFPGIY